MLILASVSLGRRGNRRLARRKENSPKLIAFMVFDEMIFGISAQIKYHEF